MCLNPSSDSSIDIKAFDSFDARYKNPNIKPNNSRNNQPLSKYFPNNSKVNIKIGINIINMIIQIRFE